MRWGISRLPSPQMKQSNPTFITQSISLSSVTPSSCRCGRVELVPGCSHTDHTLDVILLLHNYWCNSDVQKKPVWTMGDQGNFLLSSHFFRDYWFNQQAWCQPTSNQIVLMPKTRQSQGRWLVRNGLQEWKRTAGSLHWFGKAQSWFRNCVSEEKHKLVWERKIDLSLSHPLCLMPWAAMGELYLNTGTQMWYFFTCFTYQKCKGKTPLSSLKFR